MNHLAAARRSFRGIGANTPLVAQGQSGGQSVIAPLLPVRVLVPSQTWNLDEIGWIFGTSTPPFPPAGDTVIILDFYVPTARNGVIRAVGNSISGPGYTDGSGQVMFQILADGQPIQGYEAIYGSLGLVQQPTTLPCGFRILSGQHIQFTMKNVSLASGQCAARLLGTYYPASMEPSTVSY